MRTITGSQTMTERTSTSRISSAVPGGRPYLVIKRVSRSPMVRNLRVCFTPIRKSILSLHFNELLNILSTVDKKFPLPFGFFLFYQSLPTYRGDNTSNLRSNLP